jgi:hypothetical protein
LIDGLLLFLLTLLQEVSPPGMYPQSITSTLGIYQVIKTWLLTWHMPFEIPKTREYTGF